ncbi:MAG: transcription-repair coupling factor [Nitrospirota bacterium]
MGIEKISVSEKPSGTSRHTFFSAIPAGTSRIYNLSGSSVALFLSLQDKPFLAIERTEDLASRLYEDIVFFRKLLAVSEAEQLLFLPEPNGPESSGRRAGVVSGIIDGVSIVTSFNGMNSPVWTPDDLRRDTLTLERGHETEREAVEHNLLSLGHKRTSLVVERGDYCMKGWLLDIFPSTGENPVRIEFFGDEVDSIRSFDIETQRSIKTIDSVSILPASEPSEGDRITSFLKVNTFNIDIPSEAEFAPDEVVSLSRFSISGEGIDAGTLLIRGCGICYDERKSVNDLVQPLRSLSSDNKVIIVSRSSGQAERLRDILFDNGMVVPVLDSGEVKDYSGSIVITTGRLSSGLFLPGLLLLTEREIFGERPAYKPVKKSRISGLLTSIDDITPGDFIVHKDHGIGRFLNIQKQIIEGFESDLVVLEYADSARLYIPLYNIGKIKKYHAEEGVLPHIDMLGGKTWQRKKEKVKKAVMEMAEKLLSLYAEREVVSGFPCSPDVELHREFDGFFPYEPTPDQLKTIEEIKRDMETEKPMDRLLCGDVGYGKTEVAMRAAFKAVYDGRQVAVLVPTTILCEQHYLTFRDRFSAFPVKIDYLSRFKSKKEQDLTLKALSRGEIDIIIGTHALLKKGIAFSNPGLLIFDEEHRFGVAQKERIKEIAKGLDVLTMTATPIPRTLQMALSGIRAMSVIETPPEERLSVRTIISVFNEGIIREAVEKELKRGGQVLFVHNFIHDIEKMAGLLKRVAPEAKIAIGHGRMPEKMLEDVMLRFIKGEIDILLSTTIIGSGIDIPAANTIIINRADKMGLADLYQLRGRVGRSNLRAYAYFLIPGEDIIGDEAKKRLQAIRELSFLGAGFRLAMKDMEIRGAGNLLGPQQSGHIHAVGFDMYVEMLEKTVAELKGIETREEPEPSINLRVSALIPEGYIEDITLRLSIYRRIAGSGSEDGINDIESEMRDRFGSLPEEVERLLKVMKLKIMAKRLLITGISESDSKVRFIFSEDTPVKAESIFGLQKVCKDIQFQKDGFEVKVKGIADGGDVLSLVHNMLLELSKTGR